MARLALLLAAALAALCVAARAQDVPMVAVLVGSSDPVSRGDYMQDAMDGAVFGCGGADGDVSRLLTSGSDTFEGSLCTVVYGFPDDDCDQDCLVAEAVASGMYDLIIGVSFRYGGAVEAAANANPDVNFGVVDVAYDPILPNVEQFTWAEDESGFLAGVVAGEVAKSLGLTVLGGVGGIAIPPVKKFINGFAVGAQDVCPECPIYEVYSDSFGSLEEGEAHADLFIENGVEIAFCAGGYTGSMACKKLAENGVYVIGVDTDEFYTTFESGDAVGSEFLLTSALKSTARAVTFAVQCFLFNFDDCAGKNNLLNAGNGGIGTAPCHEACEVYDEDIQAKVADLYQALADEAISTGVDPMGELIVSDIVELSSP